jgi:hypothetical protein
MSNVHKLPIPEKDDDVSAAMDGLLYKISTYSNRRDLIHPLAFIVTVLACASWWWDKPQIAAFLSAFVIVLSVTLVYLIIRIRILAGELVMLADYLEPPTNKNDG